VLVETKIKENFDIKNCCSLQSSHRWTILHSNPIVK